MRIRLLFAFAIAIFGLGGLTVASGGYSSLAIAGSTPPGASPSKIAQFRDKAAFVERHAQIKRGKNGVIEASGWISVTHFDQDSKPSTKTPDDELTLNSAGGRTFTLKVPKSAKTTSTVQSSSPTQASLAPGDVTRVSGTLSGDTIVVTSAATTATLPDTQLMPSQTQRAVETRRVLTLQVTFPEDRAEGITAPYTQNVGEQAMFGRNLGDQSVHNFFKQSSREKFLLEGDVTDWMPLTQSRGTTCDEGAWMDAALAEARAQGALDVDSYDYFLLVMPPAKVNGTDICDYNGVSFGGGKTLSFALGNEFPKATSIHELGHAVGLHHAGSEICTDRGGVAVPIAVTCSKGIRNIDSAYEYTDNDDVMGEANLMRLFSNAHAAQLGFLPLDNVETIGPDGEERTLTRSNQPLASSTQLIEVRRPADDAAHRPTIRPNVYALEYRGAASPFDNYASTDTAVNRISVRLSGPAGATDPAERNTYTEGVNPSPGKSFPGIGWHIVKDYDRGLVAGQSLYDPVENYTITAGAFDATSAKVTVAPGGPPGGTAATTVVSIASGTLSVVAKPGRRNVVSVTLHDGRYVIADFGNPVLAGAGCLAMDPVTVECNATGARGLNLQLDDGDDVASVQDSVTIPTTFTGGAGNDTLEGSSGADDTFSSGTLDGADIMDGNGGSDTLTYAGRTTGVTITGYELSTTIGAMGENDRVVSIENFTGTRAADSIAPTGDVARRIDAGGGNDTVITGAGNDTILTRDGGVDTVVDCGGGNNDVQLFDSGDASTGCDGHSWEDALASIEAYPFEGETIANRTPTIPILAGGKRTTSVLQCAFGAAGSTPTWATCPSSAQYTVTSTLSDGNYTFRLRLKNSAGVTVGNEQVRNFKVNGAVPTVTIVTTPPNPSRADNVTFTSASSVAGSTFECSVEPGPWISCLPTKKVVGLTDGSRTFKVRSVGPGGAIGPASAPHTWTVDTIAPETTLAGTPAEGATTEQAPANLTYTSTESPAKFACSVNGGLPQPCSSPDTRTLGLVGPYTLRVAAVDAAGNQDPTPAVRNLTIVEQPFDTQITQAADFYAYYGPNKRPSYSFAASGTGGPFTFKCWTSDTAPAPCTSPWQAPVVSDGYTNVTIAAFNSQGVQDFTTAQEAFIGDVGLPETALTSGPAEGAVVPTDIGTAAATFGLSAPTETPAPGCSADYPPSCATFQCKLDAAPWEPCTSPYTTPSLGIGSHTLNVLATDPAGNVDSSMAVRTWIVVAAPQTAITGGPADGSTVTALSPSYTFTATPATGATFQCTYGPTTVPGTWVPCTSPWMIPAQVNGATVVVQVRAKNAAGYYDPTPDMRMVQFDLSTLLVSTATATPSAVNLTAETGHGAALDWIHWKSSTPLTVDRMNATQRISTYSTIGTASTATLNGPTTFSWTNATGATAASSSFFGVARLATGTGFSFTVPASGTEVRKLRVHLGIRGVGTTARFAVTLAGKPTVVQTISSSTAGFSNRSLTITYRPKTASDTLNVAYSQTAGGTSSGVLLNAASLH